MIQVGDLVKLRDDLIVGKDYGNVFVEDRMKFEGFREVIRVFDNGDFFVNEGNGYFYTLKMIAEIKRAEYKTIYKYERPILDDVEKEYLSAVIKPFRDKIDYIGKSLSWDYEDAEYIYIAFTSEEIMRFIHFKKGTMYKGMGLGKIYTIEELGL